ncbi:MAG: outer membrane protein assembly factor BamD [Ignavibacteria bacterium]|nr:outer membrane protein assembly factor BamD [Ignavibacteria bacterium]
MKIIQIFLLIIISSMYFSCSSGSDTIGLSPEERFTIAKAEYEDGDYEDALNELQAIILQFSGTAIIDDTQYYLGLCHFNRGEFIRAAFEFSKLIRDYPTSEYIKDAQFMLGESYLELSPHYSLDQRFSRKAIEEYQAFIDFFPTDERVPAVEKKIAQLNDKLAEKIFSSAVQYRKLNNLRSAVIYFDLLLEKFPDSKFADEALYNKIILLVDKSQNEEALSEAKRFLQKYPTSGYLKNIQTIIIDLNSKLTSN